MGYLDALGKPPLGSEGDAGREILAACASRPVVRLRFERDGKHLDPSGCKYGFDHRVAFCLLEDFMSLAPLRGPGPDFIGGAEFSAGPESWGAQTRARLAKALAEAGMSGAVALKEGPASFHCRFTGVHGFRVVLRQKKAMRSNLKGAELSATLESSARDACFGPLGRVGNCAWSELFVDQDPVYCEMLGEDLGKASSLGALALRAALREAPESPAPSRPSRDGARI